MGTVTVQRRERVPAPDIPAGDLVIAAPPEIPAWTGSRWGQLLVILPMLTGTAATAMMFAGRQGGTYAYVVGAIFGISSLGMLATGFGSTVGQPRRAEMVAARREYLRHLAGLRERARRNADMQRTGLHYRHPDPATLWSIVDSHRLWERRPGDGDFGVVRVGLGPQTLCTPLIPPVTPAPEDLEPMTSGALRRFLDTHAVVPDLPVAVSVRGFTRLYLRPGEDSRQPTGAEQRHGGQPTGGQWSGGQWSGARQRPEPAARRVLGLARALIAQLVVLHSPEDLLIAACVSADRREHWEYLKWLPHALHPTRSDAVGPVRLVAGDGPELERLLAGLLDDRPRLGSGPIAGSGSGSAAGSGSGQTAAARRPHLLIIVDGGELTAGERPAGAGPAPAPGPGGSEPTCWYGRAGVSVLDLTNPPPRAPDRTTLVLFVAPDGTLHGRSAEHDGDVGVADSLDGSAAAALARQLAPLRPAGRAAGEASAGPEPDLPDLLGLGDPGALDPSTAWAPRSSRDRLRVPIGVGPGGRPVELDLKESAQDGMGPHGLLVGATGSGKSELLRTLVLALAATHDSESLNFVLIDFKGGATFATLDRLPHTAALITNLTRELPLVDRMTDALSGELVRRQELLRRSGDLSCLRDYERARAGGAALAPLPVLLVVCDEFSELLSAKPEFIDLFVTIGRLGRSLGVHLLLASQRLEEGRLRGLDTHLSYRIGLRTFSAMESRTVLGVADAYELPRSPGHGFLKSGTEPLARFKAAYVSGPYRAPDPSGPTRPAPAVHGYGTRPVTVEAVVPAGTGTGPDLPSVLDVLVSRLVGAGPPAHQVWLPPLSSPTSLDELLGPLVSDRDAGLTVANADLRGALHVPVALVDRPFEQRRDVAWLALSGAAGHVAIVGGPRSGRSTLLRTVLVGLALTHTPRQAQVFCLDFGGGTLSGLRDLPHVSGVAGRLDRATVRRTVGEVATLLAGRERRFAAAGARSLSGWRSQGFPGDEFGDVFLAVDGWGTVRGEYEDLEPAITDIATRGLSYGIHVLATASRWMDFRPAVRDLFGSRLELRLGDVAESLLDRRTAANVPEHSPGRGLTSEGQHFLAALPRLATLDATDLVHAITAGWSGPPAPPVRLLPPVVAYACMPPGSGLAVPIGIAESDLRPVLLDFAAEPHFLLFGDTESGKSSFLRALCTGLVAAGSPEQIRIVMVDYRRSLLGTVASEHLIGYGTSSVQTAELIESVAGYMRGRLPGPEVTPAELRSRSWWTGPECFVLVDDYDLVASGPSNPLLPLLDHLAQARDIGLHLVLARRCGGAGRALFEPVIQRLRELSSPGIVMSGDREEGPLLGTVRPESLPPGRGFLVGRKEGVRLVQLALPPEGEPHPTSAG